MAIFIRGIQNNSIFTTMKLYTEEEIKNAYTQIWADGGHDKYSLSGLEEMLEQLTPIEIPSDEEILKRYIFYIDTEIQLGFLEESQGARLKWYYTKYFSNKIQGGEQ